MNCPDCKKETLQYDLIGVKCECGFKKPAEELESFMKEIWGLKIQNKDNEDHLGDFYAGMAVVERKYKLALDDLIGNLPLGTNKNIEEETKFWDKHFTNMANAQILEENPGEIT